MWSMGKCWCVVIVCTKTQLPISIRAESMAQMKRFHPSYEKSRNSSTLIISRWVQIIDVELKPFEICHLSEHASYIARQNGQWAVRHIYVAGRQAGRSNTWLQYNIIHAHGAHREEDGCRRLCVNLRSAEELVSRGTGVCHNPSQVIPHTVHVN